MGHGLLTLLNIVIKVTCEIVCCFDLSSDLYSYSVHDDIFFKQYLNIKIQLPGKQTLLASLICKHTFCN